jgi:hypothetical protein
VSSILQSIATQYNKPLNVGYNLNNGFLPIDAQLNAFQRNALTSYTLRMYQQFMDDFGERIKLSKRDLSKANLSFQVEYFNSKFLQSMHPLNGEQNNNISESDIIKGANLQQSINKLGDLSDPQPDINVFKYKYNGKKKMSELMPEDYGKLDLWEDNNVYLDEENRRIYSSVYGVNNKNLVAHHKRNYDRENIEGLRDADWGVASVYGYNSSRIDKMREERRQTNALDVAQYNAYYRKGMEFTNPMDTNEFPGSTNEFIKSGPYFTNVKSSNRRFNTY